MLMLCVRMGSLHAIEQAFRGKGRQGKRWREWIGGDLPSADRLGEVAALLELEPLRAALLKHHGQRKRKKSLPPLPGGLRVLVLDGHEMWSSYRRFCEGCCSRQVQSQDGPREQFYLRYVAAYLLCGQGRIFLDLEMQRPGEGEIAAAQRLLQRLLANCPRAFNTVAGDALYLDPALCRTLLEHNKHFIAVLKNEHRELVQDFRGLLALEDAAPLQFAFNGKQCACRDIEGFASWRQLGQPVRVVQSVETMRVRRQRDGHSQELASEWLWATSLAKAQAGTHTIVRIGHGRWDIENQGFNELVNAWHADHVYHLNINAILAILLLLFLAYNLFHVWVERGLKPALRQQRHTAYFHHQVHAEFYLRLRPG